MSENRPEFNEEEEYIPEGLFVNPDDANSFDEIVAQIFTQSVENSATLSRLSSQCSQQLIESQSSDTDVEQVAATTTTEQSTMTVEEALTQEYNRTQAFKEIVNSIIEKLGEKYENLDLPSKLKIILTRPKLLGSTIATGFTAVTCVHRFWNNPFNLYTNIIGAASTAIGTYILSNPEEASKILALLNPTFLMNYYNKMSQIEELKNEIVIENIDKDINKELMETLKLKMEVVDETYKQNKEIGELIVESEKRNLNSQIETTLTEASQLNQTNDIIKFYGIVENLYGRIVGDNRSNIGIEFINLINTIFAGDDIEKKEIVISFVAGINKEQVNDDQELQILLGKLKTKLAAPSTTTSRQSTTEKRKSENGSSSLKQPRAGGGSTGWYGYGGRRKTHKKSKKSKKHHKKHHKKTAHKKRGSRRK